MATQCARLEAWRRCLNRRRCPRRSQWHRPTESTGCSPAAFAEARTGALTASGTLSTRVEAGGAFGWPVTARAGAALAISTGAAFYAAATPPLVIGPGLTVVITDRVTIAISPTCRKRRVGQRRVIRRSRSAAVVNSLCRSAGAEAIAVGSVRHRANVTHPAGQRRRLLVDNQPISSPKSPSSGLRMPCGGLQSPVPAGSGWPCWKSPAASASRWHRGRLTVPAFGTGPPPAPSELGRKAVEPVAIGIAAGRRHRVRPVGHATTKPSAVPADRGGSPRTRRGVRRVAGLPGADLRRKVFVVSFVFQRTGTDVETFVSS